MKLEWPTKDEFYAILLRSAHATCSMYGMFAPDVGTEVTNNVTKYWSLRLYSRAAWRKFGVFAPDSDTSVIDMNATLKVDEIRKIEDN